MPDVLDDDVDRDSRRPERLEDRRGDAWAVAHAEYGDLRNVGFLRDAAHALPVFHRYLSDDHRTHAVVEARTHVDGDIEKTGDLDRAWMHHAGADRSQLQHLVLADMGELARVLHHPRIPRVDAVDVGGDLARVTAA